MTEIFAMSPVGFDSPMPQINRLGVDLPANPLRDTGSASFDSILAAGVETLDGKIAKANTLIRQFAIDDNIPVHQVTIALEEARLAVELAMQVRARLIEGYRELMNMQL